MSEIDLQAIASRRIVYERGADVVGQPHHYRAADGSMQPLTIYRPAGSTPALPAVVIVTGYPDAGVRRIFGRNAQDFGTNVSWAELLAASGLVAATYVNVEPVADAVAVVQHIRGEAAALGIAGDRIGVWSCSGNAPNALGLLMQADRTPLTCAAFLYGYMLDLDGMTAVADGAKFGYANPAAGKSVRDLPRDLPLFIARAGRDEMPNLNQTIDAFAAHALAANLPLTLANHHTARHAFDAIDRSVATTFLIEQVVQFFQRHLRA